MAISFELTPEQEALQKRMREFAEKEIAPRAAEIDEKDEIPQELWDKICRPPNCFPAANLPKEYGGTGLDKVSICLMVEEIAYASAVCSILMEVLLPAGPIMIAGSEEQKKKYLLPIARGELFTAITMTEPGAGSDAGAIVTRAERARDDYILNGRKRYISFADKASVFVTSAKTDAAAGARGVSLFLVDKGSPGLTIGESLRTLGLKGHHAFAVTFDNCRVPKESLVGEEGKGLRYLLGILDESRVTLASGYIGLARACLDAALKFAKGRVVFGSPIAEYQAIRFPLAEIAMEIEAARLLVYKAAWLSDQGVRHTKESSMAKLYAAQLMIRASNVAASALGGFGCTSETPVERYYRDARTWVYAQGTPEIQKLVISREVFR